MIKPKPAKYFKKYRTGCMRKMLAAHKITNNIAKKKGVILPLILKFFDVFEAFSQTYIVNCKIAVLVYFSNARQLERQNTIFEAKYNNCYIIFCFPKYQKLEQHPWKLK